MKTKFCTTCKKEKPCSEYGKYARGKDGLQAKCKSCNKAYYESNKSKLLVSKQDYYTKNKDLILDHKKRYRSIKSEQIAEYNKIYYRENQGLIKERNAVYYQNNKGNLKEKSNSYYWVNKERCLEANKSYCDLNRQKVNKQKSFYSRNKRKTNPIFQCSEVCRDMLRRVLNSKRKLTPTSEALGYTSLDLKNHIESKFEDGMSWDNRDLWHIDHIRPVIDFLNNGVTDPSVINALENLQPLWKEDNLAKGASI